MRDWTVRDPKLQRTMRDAWILRDRDLRDAVAAQAQRHAEWHAHIAEARRCIPERIGLRERLRCWLQRRQRMIRPLLHKATR